MFPSLLRGTLLAGLLGFALCVSGAAETISGEMPTVAVDGNIQDTEGADPIPRDAGEEDNTDASEEDSVPDLGDAPPPAAVPFFGADDGEVDVEDDDGSAEGAEQVITEIRFIGNQLHSNRKLERRIKSRRKQAFDRQRLHDDMRILWETGFFEDVQVGYRVDEKPAPRGRQGIIAEFMVVERPVIRRIDYKGNRKLSAGSFDTKVQSKEGDPFDRIKAGLDARAILEHYRDEGYAHAEVEHYTTLDPRANRVILTFFIVEGERVLVERVTVDGNARFSDRRIRRRMKTRRKKIFKEAVLREDEHRIVDYYRNRGHLDVALAPVVVDRDPERNRVSIGISIEEGPRYQIGDITIDASPIVKPKALRRAVTLRSDRQFRQNKLDESVAGVAELFADKGYLRTHVEAVPERRPEAGRVDYHFEIEESEVVYVDGVFVDGNTYTKTHVIRREVLLNPGDVFAAGRMRRSVERLYNLGFLDEVQVDVQQPRDPNLADLIFSVTEGKPGILSAGAGFSNVDRFVGTVSVQHTNLFGLAQRVNVSYEFGARRQNFEIGWMDPWFLGYRMSGGVDLFNTVRRRDYPGTRNAFREKRRGASARVGPRLTENFGLLFGYTIQTSEIYDVDPAIRKDLFPTFGVSEDRALETGSIQQIKSSFLTEAAMDTRDNRFDANRGSRNAASVELAGGPFGGDIHYYKPQVTTVWYFPTFWKFVFSVSGRAAWVNSFAPSKDVPSSERFFLGGADTVRGYDTNSIAPRRNDLNQFGDLETRRIPGRILALFNAEYKFPIVQQGNRTIFQGAFFLDCGGTWLRTDEINLTTGAADRRMKAGVGFGFRIKTPVFPIRLDFAIPLNPRDADGTRAADSRSLQPYFTIGNIF